MLTLHGNRFVDASGRTVMLRGINLGGSSKIPVRPDGATHLREGFSNHREVSFVGRPFPLEEADEHFSRLKDWGFNMLRFLVTWEAIEHDGPGQYDIAYLDYLTAVVQKAGEYDLPLFIDPHQDVWSRFSGGDGAPGWTLEMAGFNLTHIQPTGAAVVHQWTEGPYSQQIWFTNGFKLAAATMFSLFFAGNDLAPETRFDGEPVQEFLQRHYIAAIQQVAERMRTFDHVIGYDTLNEPLPGYVGMEDLRNPPDYYPNGNNPSPYQSMLLGAGFPQRVDFWKMTMLGPQRRGSRLLNPDGLRVWREGHPCIWRQNGVWDLNAKGSPYLLRPGHFAKLNGEKIDFNQDYLRPFINRFSREIRKIDPRAIIFMETIPEHASPTWGQEDADRIVYAPHWYDPVALTLKRSITWFGYDATERKILLGRRRIEREYAALLRARKDDAQTKLNNPPTLIGEIGISYNLNNARAYKTDDFTAQIKMMDRSMKALEANLLHVTLWNYTSDNNNLYGDLWNCEDLSIFSRDQQKDPENLNSGGRALKAVVRPYPLATAGIPLDLSFDIHSRRFLFRFEHSPGISEPTILFLPRLQYPESVNITVSDGRFELDIPNQQLLYWHTEKMEIHLLEVCPG
ncbi:MAG: cellulase family glycosylhydrolase [Anaerolineales bacterium]|nr:cellulase family glycosylhydrolase [Anaerolineales bacterium]